MLFLHRNAPVCGCPIQCREYSCPSHTIENISGIRHRIDISLRHIVEIPRWVPSFFFTKITRLAQEEEEGRMIPFSSISSICLDTSASISGETRNGRLLIGRSSRRVITCSAVPISRGLFGFSAKTSFHLDSTLRMAVSSRGDSFGFISNLASKLSPSFPISVCIISALVAAYPRVPQLKRFSNNHLA